MTTQSQPPLLNNPPTYPPPRIKLLPLREQPAYRVAHNPENCNLIELLAAVIGGQKQIELAEALLAQFGDVAQLAQAQVADMSRLPGIGEQTAVRLKAAMTLGVRMQIATFDRPTIHSPADAAALIQYEMSALQQEHLRVILLNTRNRVIGMEDLYKGSLNSSQVRVGEIFRFAIRRNAAALIVAHNHPSSDPSPSPDDVAITRAIVQAGELLDIQLLDHLIICHGRYVSMKERGLGFS